MNRIVAIAAACSALLASGPARAAPVPATAAAQVGIVEPGIVRMMWWLAMPSIQGTASGAAFSGNAPSMSMANAPVVRNDSALRRQVEQPLALTAPGSFMVMRLEGGDSVMLRTNPGGDYGAVGDGVLMGGRLLGGAAASIEVGGLVSAASAPALQAAPAGQTLVVVVQYN